MRLVTEPYSVDIRKLNVPSGLGKNKEFFERKSLPDGSVTVTVWNRRSVDVQLKIRKRYSLYVEQAGFDLEPEITNKEILLTVVITRPSERYFKVFVINNDGVQNESFINYKDLNAFLQFLFKPYY